MVAPGARFGPSFCLNLKRGEWLGLNLRNKLFSPIFRGGSDEPRFSEAEELGAQLYRELYPELFDTIERGEA